MERLTDTLWVRQSRLFQMNSGVFLSGGRACLVDPGMYPDELAAIAAFLGEQGAVAEAIVLTHIHWDHILGPERFPGVPVLAQAGLTELARTHGAEVVADVLGWVEKEQVPRKGPFTIPEPAQTFDQTMTLPLGDLRLRLAHAPGHSPDMLVIYDEDAATLWAADILSDIEIPGIADSLLAYERTLAMLAGWEIRALVPGHGSPTVDHAEIAGRLRDDIAYLDELHTLLDRALAECRSMEEAQQLCAGMTYRLPEENSYIHRFNVETAYKELARSGPA